MVEIQQRVIIFAPVGRDGELTHDVLSRASIGSVVCRSVDEVCREIEQGAGALMITEEALDDEAYPCITQRLDAQPPWSDLPVLIFAGSERTNASLRTVRMVEALRNVTILERPIRVAAVVSLVAAALRARARQYETRDLLVALQAARAEAETASRLKDEFLATLSHELRTPLNAILGWITLLRHNQLPADRVEGALDVIDRNARAQAQLIEDVLDMARIITGKLRLQMTPIALPEIVAAAVDSVRPGATAKGVRLVIDDGGTVPPVLGDAARLQQILWNLLSNAVKFTPGGGDVRIAIESTGAQVVITVADTGTGLAPAFVPFVFDRFRQADQSATRGHGGLGLGLAIVKHLVELHGGTVEASSPGLGQGATFVVTLPVPAETQPLAARIPGDATDQDAFAIRLEGRDLLVVDDDAATRELMCELLGRAGARVTAVPSADAALETVQSRRLDLIIADLGMPEQDGYSLIRRVRELPGPRGHTPAIALSAFARPEDRQAANEAGFTRFIAKPAAPQDVLREVQKLVGRAAGAG